MDKNDAGAALREKMLAVIADVNSRVAEREELVELIAIALLTRNNLFILGRPGQAKSYSINLFRERIAGARQFERLLSKQTDEEQLFGRIDLSSLLPGHVPEAALQGDVVYEGLRRDLQERLGEMREKEAFVQLEDATEKLESYRRAVAALRRSEPVVQTAGKIPEADIVFLDEIFKCNDGMLNSLLTALNERRYTNEGRTYTIPAVSFFAASNEIPNFADPQDRILEALYDRLQIKVVTEDIEDREKRLAVLRAKQQAAVNEPAATISMEELVQMQREVAGLPVPDTVNELADDILCELRKARIVVSDRKYLNYFPLAQAKAWLEGHGEVMPQDLLILQCYLWQKPAERPVVEQTLQRLCVNPMQEKVKNISDMAADSRAEFEALRTERPDDVRAGRRALGKLRGELLRLYQMQQALAQVAQSDSERQLTSDLLGELEAISRSAHEGVGFTYVPLEQLAAMQ